MNCKFTIKNLPCNGFFGICITGKNFYVRLQSIYTTSSVTINTDNGTGLLELSDAQVVVDATGKAQDVLRRIQVRYNVNTSGDIVPLFAVHSAGSICKRITVLGGVANTVSPSVVSDPAACAIP
jgi:hypothetical protein